MAWYIKNTNELWTGPTHYFQGWTWTGATKTRDSLKLVEGEEPVQARTKKGQYKGDDPSTPHIDESKAKPKTAAQKRAARKSTIIEE